MRLSTIEDVPRRTESAIGCHLPSRWGVSGAFFGRRDDLAADDVFEDLVAAAVDGLDARVDEGARHRRVAQVSGAAVQLYRLRRHAALQLGRPATNIPLIFRHAFSYRTRWTAHSLIGRPYLRRHQRGTRTPHRYWIIKIKLQLGTKSWPCRPWRCRDVRAGATGRTGRRRPASRKSPSSFRPTCAAPSVQTGYSHWPNQHTQRIRKNPLHGTATLLIFASYGFQEKQRQSDPLQQLIALQPTRLVVDNVSVSTTRWSFKNNAEKEPSKAK